MDIAFERGNVGRTLFNEALTADDVGYAKSWFVLGALITTGRVEYVSPTTACTPPDGGRPGWAGTRTTLDAFFLLEDESGYRGIIRHAPGHLAHFHVRFRCPEGDADCY
ncbi:MAG: penicillin-insensitive murein endopeptidase [Deltaproteobacteria bacterium]|nr:penicillin-insensitive murein endopeptidase [Deltaproteobacteria bacterium]